jgi:hypothetical protein
MRHKKNEELKGGQHKLDKDGDGKITGKDFKILKSKKSHKFADWVEAKEGQLDEILSWNPMDWGKTKAQVQGRNAAQRFVDRESENKMAKYQQGAEQLHAAKGLSGSVRGKFDGAIKNLKAMGNFAERMESQVKAVIEKNQKDIQNIGQNVLDIATEAEQAGGLPMDPGNKEDLRKQIENMVGVYSRNGDAVLEFMDTELKQYMQTNVQNLDPFITAIQKIMANQLSQAGRDIRRELAPRANKKYTPGAQDTVAGRAGTTANPARLNY